MLAAALQLAGLIRTLLISHKLAVAMMADRVQIYRMYFHSIPMHNDAIADTLSISFASLGCLAYTFSNFHSALLLIRGSNTLESTGRVWLGTYNACFGIASAGWIISSVVNTFPDMLHRCVSSPV